jgi:hypothetical protein
LLTWPADKIDGTPINPSYLTDIGHEQQLILEQILFCSFFLLLLFILSCIIVITHWGVITLAEWLNIQDAAAQWGISRSLLARLCRDGRIAGAQKIKGAWMIPEDAEYPADERRKSDSVNPETASCSSSIASATVCFGCDSPIVNDTVPPSHSAGHPISLNPS